MSQPLGETQSPAVLALRILAEGVLVDGDEGVRKSGRLAYLEPLVIGESTLSQEGRVLRADERKVNDGGNDRICCNQAYRLRR